MFFDNKSHRKKNFVYLYLLTGQDIKFRGY